MSIFSTILEKLGIQKPEASQKSAKIQMADVVVKLDRLAKEGPIKGLNWRMSINDLLALLGLDHSSAGIKELAVELGCPESEMGDSYKRNVWAHKELLRRIAENGGNIPEKLLHKSFQEKATKNHLSN
jgi:hypothetical protein